MMNGTLFVLICLDWLMIVVVTVQVWGSLGSHKHRLRNLGTDTNCDWGRSRADFHSLTQFPVRGRAGTVCLGPGEHCWGLSRLSWLCVNWRDPTAASPVSQISCNVELNPWVWLVCWSFYKNSSLCFLSNSSITYSFGYQVLRRNALCDRLVCLSVRMFSR